MHKQALRNRLKFAISLEYLLFYLVNNRISLRVKYMDIDFNKD